MKYEDGKLFIRWQDIDYFCLEIAHAAREKNIEEVVGISRGGLIPGVIISHLLEVPFSSFVWETRDGERKDVSKVFHYNDPKYLIVDDIVDSGKTILDIMSLAPEASTAVLFNKREDIVLDIVGQNLYNVSEWCVFPWEKE